MLPATSSSSPLLKKNQTHTQQQPNHTKRKLAVIDPKLANSRVAKRKTSTQPVPSTHQNNTHKPAYRNAPSPELPSAAGFEPAVLGGELWCAPCRAASQTNADAIGSVPLRFISAKHYVETFEPLLFAEARESLLADFAEGIERHTYHTVKVLRYY